MEVFKPTKSVVIYDSQYGNTQAIAEVIAAEVQAPGAVEVENARTGTPANRSTEYDAWSRLMRGGPDEHHRHVAQLHELASHAARERAHYPTAAMGSHYHQRRVALGHGFLDPARCLANAATRTSQVALNQALIIAPWQRRETFIAKGV